MRKNFITGIKQICRHNKFQPFQDRVVTLTVKFISFHNALDERFGIRREHAPNSRDCKNIGMSVVDLFDVIAALWSARHCSRC